MHYYVVDAGPFTATLGKCMLIHSIDALRYHNIRERMLVILAKACRPYHSEWMLPL